LTGKRVAIKKVTNTFADLIDAKRIMREIKLLHQLGSHENIVGLLDVMTSPPLNRDFNDVYIVCDLMECDLDRIVSSDQALSDSHAQYFVYQVLRGLKYIHSANVLHRDLKPSNLLVNSNCDLSICDFGLARGVVEDETLTEYVVTRWYRAPELLTESQYYGPPVDVWSVGCILAEILLRRPLFQGRDYMHQLQVIIDMLGTPSEESLAFITNSMAKKAILELPKRQKRSFRDVLPDTNGHALDLLERMLIFIHGNDAQSKRLLLTLISPPFTMPMKSQSARSILRWLWRENIRMGRGPFQSVCCKIKFTMICSYFILKRRS